MSESDLDSLVYVSSAVRLLGFDEIAYLLKRARERNKEYGITGVLLYDQGNSCYTSKVLKRIAM